MGLYDREYGKSNTTQSGFFGNSRQEEITENYEQDYVIEDINEFVKTTYKYFAASLLAGAAGAYTGIGALGIGCG